MDIFDKVFYFKGLIATTFTQTTFTSAERKLNLVLFPIRPWNDIQKNLKKRNM